MKALNAMKRNDREEEDENEYDKQMEAEPAKEDDKDMSTGGTWLTDALKDIEDAGQREAARPNGRIDTSFYQKLRREGRGRRRTRKEEDHFFRKLMEYRDKRKGRE